MLNFYSSLFSPFEVEVFLNFRVKLKILQVYVWMHNEYDWFISYLFILEFHVQNFSLYKDLHFKGMNTFCKRLPL